MFPDLIAGQPACTPHRGCYPEAPVKLARVLNRGRQHASRGEGSALPKFRIHYAVGNTGATRINGDRFSRGGVEVDVPFATGLGLFLILNYQLTNSPNYQILSDFVAACIATSTKF